MTRLRLSLCAVLLSLAAACGHGFELQRPDGFVTIELDDPVLGYAERSANAHGVVIAVRELENEAEGSLGFWTDAIKNRLRRAGGYALLDESDVRAATGEAGKQLRFGRDENQRPYLYWVTLFVHEDSLFVIEAGGRKDVFEPAMDEVVRAIQGFRVR